MVDEVGYIPFDPEAANLMFSLVSARYERASMIVTSNKPFSAWGEIFGDDVTAAAMIDRLVHHADILNLKGDSYRLSGKDVDARLGRTTRPNRVTSPTTTPDPSIRHAQQQAGTLKRLVQPLARPAKGTPLAQTGATRPPRPASQRYRRARRPASDTPTPSSAWSTFQPAKPGHFSTGLDTAGWGSWAGGPERTVHV